ncbi:hypothetical protein HYALB_00002483 [Hymenoscyphus albidus]|uniref:Uncharacterized protein n=1 Tax=Hymenoscyphus albidus TaxID=595503 RepID=A0A9N9LVP0_9HELO|nr:hypothetical protein HYALB_00002483 [Hymenoscyphus albidus]
MLFWSRLKKYPHGQDLLSYDFTSIPNFSEMEAFSYLTFWAELDFVFRLRFNEASLFRPDAFEETILRKMIATWYDDGVDERPQLDPREERTELIIELGKKKAKRQSVGGEQQEHRCSICLASTITEDDAPGDFEFFLGFNGKSFS